MSFREMADLWSPFHRCLGVHLERSSPSAELAIRLLLAERALREENGKILGFDGEDAILRDSSGNLLRVFRHALTEESLGRMETMAANQESEQREALVDQGLQLVKEQRIFLDDTP